MAGEWRECDWGDIATLEYGRALRGYENASGRFRVYGTNGPIGWHEEALCLHPGVVVGRKGAYRGIHYSPEPFSVIDTAFYLEPKEKEALDLRWAYYALLTYDINGMDSGSAIPSTSREAFYGLPVRVPPPDEQRAIAHILGTLDDRIELNQRMNETLEAIARAIFKSWFVDFDPVRAKAEGRDTGLPPGLATLFPDRFQGSDLGDIPKEWTIKTVGDVAERVAMGPFGSSIKVASFVRDGIPVISGQHLHGCMLEDTTFNFITYEHAERLKNALVYRGDVVFTHAGNIGQVAYIPENSRYERYVISQRQFYMRCDLAQVSPSFIAYYFRSPAGQHRLLANASSSGVPSIARPVTYLRSIPLPVPPPRVLTAFEKLARPIHMQFRRNMDQSTALAALRDTLLPKLISGELRVPNAERIIGRIA